MQDGIVKYYHATRGFGFIECSDGSSDVFFHISGFEELGNPENLPRVGMRVMFEVEEGTRGPVAVNIKTSREEEEDQQ